jgi:phosphoribosylanthranilate isomerase
MTAVKICGVTRLDDAEAASTAGADFVGFVLWATSPRAATIDRVREIVAKLPGGVTPVGVFVDPALDDLKAAEDAGLRMAQIHGAPPAELRGVSIPIMRAVHLSTDGIEPNVPDELVLLDAHDPERHGGTGRTIDWRRASLIARRRRIILAGGLTPANVRRAIEEVRPYGVDVASGVESAPGIKDHELLRAFIAAVRTAATPGTEGTHGN